MNYTHVFWDWNGTMIDDLRYSVDVVNVSLKKRNLPLLTIEKYLKTFRFPIKDYYQDLGFDFSIDSYENLAIEYHDLYQKNCKNLTLHDGLKEVLAVFASKNIPQYVLSASERKILEDGLDYYGIRKYFTSISALENYYAFSKISIGKALVSTMPKDAKILMIGDSEHDYEVASAVGIDCVLFSKGHGLRERLTSLNVPVIDDLRQLYPIVLNTEKKGTPPKLHTVFDRETRSYDLSDSQPETFSTRYKDFYDDLKNTNKTEDW